MEETLAIVSKESVLSLPKTTEQEKEFTDPLAPSHPTWSSRYKCFQAYFCFVMSYLSVLKFCERVGKYKLTIFIPYLFFYIFIGLPAVLVEIMLGRYVMGNISQAWNMCPPARGIFWCLCIVTFYAITVNYVCDICILKYTFSSFRGFILWESCEVPWASPSCYTIGKKSEAIAKCMESHSETYCVNLPWESSGKQFWRNSIENRDNVLEIFLSFIYLVISVSSIAATTYKGIRSLEKMLDLLLYPTIVLWTIFAIVSLSTSKALIGFSQLCTFNWSEFVKPQIWLDGFEDTFYLLGLGRLSLSCISSHGKFTDNILVDVLIVIFASIISCVLLTIPILSIISISKEFDGGRDNEPLFKDVTDVFVSISEALIFYPYPNTLWAAIYYINCFLISLSSQTVLALALCEAIDAVIGIKGKTYFSIAAVSVTTVFSAAVIIFFKFMYDVSHSTVVATNILLHTITWQLFYGIRKFNYDYYFMMGYPLPIFIRCTWITLPLLPFAGLILKMYYKMPNKPLENMVYIYVGLTVALYIFVIIFKMVMFQTHKQKISRVFMANPNWGPQNPLLKRSRLYFEMSTVTREFMYRQELYKKPFIKPPDFSKQNIVQLL